MIGEPIELRLVAGPPWKVIDAVWAFMAGLVAVAIALAVVGADPSAAQIFAIVLPAQYAGTIAALYLVSRARGSGSLIQDLGLELRSADGWMVLIGLALQIVVLLFLAQVVDVEEAPQEIARLSREAEGGAAILALISTALVAPLVEEAMFRGVLLASLVRQMPPGWALVISAGAFALSHLAAPDNLIIIPPLFVVGLVLGYLALTRGLGRSVAAHAGFNLLPALVFLTG